MSPKSSTTHMEIAGSTYHLEAHPKYGFMQVRPTPSLEEIIHFYAKEFYSSNYPRCNDSSLDVQVRDKEFYNGNREAMCREIMEISGKPLKGMTLLDIGCGWGQAMLYFRERGLICYGFDPVPEAIEYAQHQKLNVIKAGMDKMNVFPKVKFDVVTLLNVLEHLADPEAVLKEIRRDVLKPGGILIVDVPNEFNAFQLGGQRVHDLAPWWVCPPNHLNYFSGSTLKKLLQGTGFRVEALESSFPLEMFLLFGQNYVKDGKLGRQCHEQRINFELNLRKNGFNDVLRTLYRSFAEQNLGRQVVAYAVAERKK